MRSDNFATIEGRMSSSPLYYVDTVGTLGHDGRANSFKGSKKRSRDSYDLACAPPLDASSIVPAQTSRKRRRSGRDGVSDFQMFGDTRGRDNHNTTFTVTDHCGAWSDPLHTTGGYHERNCSGRFTSPPRTSGARGGKKKGKQQNGQFSTVSPNKGGGTMGDIQMNLRFKELNLTGLLPTLLMAAALTRTCEILVALSLFHCPSVSVHQSGCLLFIYRLSFVWILFCFPQQVRSANMTSCCEERSLSSFVSDLLAPARRCWLCGRGCEDWKWGR